MIRRSPTRGGLERLEDRLGRDTVSLRAVMGAPLGVQLRDVRVPREGNVEVDDTDIQIFENREDLAAGPIHIRPLAFIDIPGLGGEVDEVERAAPSLNRLPRLVEHLSEERQIDACGVQPGLPDVQAQSLPQGPESPES